MTGFGGTCLRCATADARTVGLQAGAHPRTASRDNYEGTAPLWLDPAAVTDRSRAISRDRHPIPERF